MHSAGEKIGRNDVTELSCGLDMDNMLSDSTNEVYDFEQLQYTNFHIWQVTYISDFPFTFGMQQDLADLHVLDDAVSIYI